MARLVSGIVEVRFDAEGRGRGLPLRRGQRASSSASTGLPAAAGRWMSDLEPGQGDTGSRPFGDVVMTGADARFRGATSEFGRVFDMHAVRIGDQAQNRVCGAVRGRCRPPGGRGASGRRGTATGWSSVTWYGGTRRGPPRRLRPRRHLPGGQPAWTATLGWPAAAWSAPASSCCCTQTTAWPRRGPSRGYGRPAPRRTLDVRFRTAEWRPSMDLVERHPAG